MLRGATACQRKHRGRRIVPPSWQGLTSPADIHTTPHEIALQQNTIGVVATSLHANLNDDPRHRTGSSVLALYIELRLVPNAAAALKDAARYALACPAPPEGCTDSELVQAWTDAWVRLQSRVLAVGQVFKWALKAILQTLCVEGRKVQARKHALLVLQQLSQNGTWSSLADACVRLCPRLLPEQSGSTPPSSAQPQHIIQQWAQVLEQAVHNGEGSAEAPQMVGSSHRRKAGTPVAAAIAEVSKRDILE